MEQPFQARISVEGNSGGIGLKEVANRTVEELRNYFEKRDDIVMAFLFGSRAKGHDGAESGLHPKP